jgi:hypothetical protein
MSRDLPVFDAKWSDWRDEKRKQSKAYGRLRSAIRLGFIDYVKVDGKIRLNRKQADAWLAADRLSASGDLETQSVPQCNAADLGRLVIAVEDMAVAIRQALAAISQNA